MIEGYNTDGIIKHVTIVSLLLVHSRIFLLPSKFIVLIEPMGRFPNHESEYIASVKIINQLY